MNSVSYLLYGQVNISATMRNLVLQQVESGNIDHTVFDASLKEITKLLETDSFPHFMSSPMYAEVIAIRQHQQQQALVTQVRACLYVPVYRWGTRLQFM
jgi:hypothetical protein